MTIALKAVPGEILDGRFLLVEERGQGGMSTVFKALDLEDSRKVVAVKVPLPKYASGLGAWSMFQREAEIGIRLNHPYILRFVATAPSRHQGYVVTEYVTGTTLGARMRMGPELSQSEVLSIMSRLCEAVEYLHGQEVVHYDLKPENVILCEDRSIRLIDFGLAHEVVRSRFAFAGLAPPIASSHYVAPEQIRRQRGRTNVDVYALGAMLYEMLTGHPPFEGDDPFVVASARQIGDPMAPRVLSPAVSVELEEVVLRALRRDPTERYGSAAAMKIDLDHPAEVRVSGLAARLVEVTRWRKLLRLIRYGTLVGVAPVAFLVALFRVLWWYLERTP